METRSLASPPTPPLAMSTGRRWSLPIALALALALAACMLAPPSADARGRSPVVSAPPQGARVAGPVRVVLRNPLGLVSVRLNGRRVDLPPPARSGRQVLLLGAGDGLRRGVNVLRVRRGLAGRARWVRRFRVRARQPLAGAPGRRMVL